MTFFRSSTTAVAVNDPVYSETFGWFLSLKEGTEISAIAYVSTNLPANSFVDGVHLVKGMWYIPYGNDIPFAQVEGSIDLTYLHNVPAAPPSIFGFNFAKRVVIPYDSNGIQLFLTKSDVLPGAVSDYALLDVVIP